MPAQYILVDFENVQPESLPLQGDTWVKIFLGPNQGKLSVELVSLLQPLGDRVEYIRMDTAGRNALDFHIAYYIGALASKDPAGQFHIVSADSGFDPLIRHLTTLGVSVKRRALSKPPAPPVATAMIERAVNDLTNRKASRPKTRTALLNTLKSSVGRQLNGSQMQQLFAELQRKGFVSLDGERVSYVLS